MSLENVEIVRRYYEAYAQGGFDRLMDYWSDDLDHRAAKDGVDDPGPIRGRTAMRKHIGDWIDTFDEFWFEADQTSGVVLTIREGKIARCREYATRAEALAAAGLAE